MVTALDRLTIYSVLCFLSFCALVFKTSADTSLMPLIGMMATITGIWIEMHKWSGGSEQEN
ncbi:hypothetical protein ATG66_4058 [Vibrio sp. ES.051]|uniref:hypothetical protein n=1 Tax=Vibrio sp. ES.051 TaxID=1761909 RepID=UPI000BFA0920|nr:hypothetical protein [Vibrio sp. ES.051]PFG45745.1 hypothetical protein ATG66_4058 [Vibrio sp. ES.051]